MDYPQGRDPNTHDRGTDDTGTDSWQPPSWTSSTSQSSLFGNSSEDSRPAGPPTPPSPAPSQHFPSQQLPAPAPPTAAPFGSTSSAGVQPNYDAGYSSTAYGYTPDPAEPAPLASAGDPYAQTGNPYAQTSGSGSSYVPTNPNSLPGAKATSVSAGSRSAAPMGIVTGLMCLFVCLVFGRNSFFGLFPWIFVAVCGFSNVKLVISKTGNRSANRIFGGIGLVLCAAGVISMLVLPHGGFTAFDLFRLMLH